MADGFSGGQWGGLPQAASAQLPLTRVAGSGDALSVRNHLAAQTERRFRFLGAGDAKGDSVLRENRAGDRSWLASMLGVLCRSIHDRRLSRHGSVVLILVLSRVWRGRRLYGRRCMGAGQVGAGTSDLATQIAPTTGVSGFSPRSAFPPWGANAICTRERRPGSTRSARHRRLVPATSFHTPEAFLTTSTISRRPAPQAPKTRRSVNAFTS